MVSSTRAVTGFNLTAGGLVINSTDIGTVSNILADDSGGVFTAALNAVTGSTGVTASLDTATGLITLTASDGRNVDVVVESSKLRTFSSQVASAPLRLTSNEPFSVGGSSSSILGVAGGLFTLGLTDVVSAIQVTTTSGANSALATLDAAIDQVSIRRGDLGAVQNRLESAISGLQSKSENLSNAQARIQDADFAHETARLARATIMQQAATSLLAQANIHPAVVLELLS